MCLYLEDSHDLTKIWARPYFEQSADEGDMIIYSIRAFQGAYPTALKLYPVDLMKRCHQARNGIRLPFL